MSAKLNDKRYVFFIGALREGGAERVISILTRRFAEMGSDITILLYYDDEPFYEIAPDVKLVSVMRETKSRSYLTNLMWIRRFFRERADVVVSFLAPFNMLAAVANLGNRVPLIVADRNDPRHIPSNPVIRAARNVLYHFAQGVTVQTTHNQAYFSAAIQKKSKVIFNPIDLGEKAGMALRSEKKKTIVSMGRLMPQKNQQMLLEAFARLHPEFPEYQLIIYGEGPRREELLEKAKELGVSGHFSLPGNLKDVHDRIADASCFVLCSHYEGMPNALIEAMCLGLPVVSTDVSGASDLIRNGENGLIVPCSDADALTEAIRRMIGDPAFAENCARSAVAVNQMLDAERICAEWIDCIHGVMKA